MFGDDDEVTLEHAVALYRALPEAELAIVPGTSHGLLVEKPELCNGLIVDFLVNDPVPTLAPIRRAAGGRSPVPTFARPLPILRIFDRAKARAFYVEYLGFRVDWEHRFSADAPLYMQVSRGGMVLHLSEHHGDGTPGSAVYVETEGVRSYHAELQGKGYRFLNPGVEVDEIGTCMTLLDPFGNTLRFNERP
jgi:ribosomal-protein-alanine N-acetyltransferase